MYFLVETEDEMYGSHDREFGTDELTAANAQAVRWSKKYGIAYVVAIKSSGRRGTPPSRIGHRVYGDGAFLRQEGGGF